MNRSTPDRLVPAQVFVGIGAVIAVLTVVYGVFADEEAGKGLLTVTVAFPTFADWWAPFLLGVGPAGAYVAQLDPVSRDALRDHSAELLPAAPFEQRAAAWSVFGRA